MTTADTEAPTTRFSRLRRTWEKVATVLAVIGLVDLTKQLIEWSALIHWIATKYAIARAWFFGWLPWHIPPEWHDAIVLLLILFSVLNVGVYRRTGNTLASLLFKDRRQLVTTIVLTVIGFMGIVIINFIIISFFEPPPSVSGRHFLIFVAYPLIATAFLYAILFASVVFFYNAMALAWRWVLTTAAIFIALVAINYAYVLWLEPPAEHH